MSDPGRKRSGAALRRRYFERGYTVNWIQHRAGAAVAMVTVALTLLGSNDINTCEASSSLPTGAWIDKYKIRCVLTKRLSKQTKTERRFGNQ